MDRGATHVVGPDRPWKSLNIQNIMTNFLVHVAYERYQSGNIRPKPSVVSGY